MNAESRAEPRDEAQGAAHEAPKSDPARHVPAAHHRSSDYVNGEAEENGGEDRKQGTPSTRADQSFQSLLTLAFDYLVWPRCSTLQTSMNIGVHSTQTCNDRLHNPPHQRTRIQSTVS